MAEGGEMPNELGANLENSPPQMDDVEEKMFALELNDCAAELEELAVMQNSIDKVKQELNEREQGTLLTDIDIGHVPEVKNENLVKIVRLIGAQLGKNLTPNDIVYAERYGTTQFCPPEEAEHVDLRARRIVVRLANRRVRDELLSAARERPDLTTASIGIQGPVERIYINERLTRTNRRLFHMVRSECRVYGWRYSWVKNGRIYVRRNEQSSIIHIRNEADLHKVFEPAFLQGGH